MDTIDKQIVHLLGKNARIPLKELAEKVFLSSPAVSARLERLEKKGIISGYRVVLNREKLGYKINAYVNVVIPPEKRSNFTEYVRNCPNVLECCHVAGIYSMVLKVSFLDMQELNAFIAEVQKFGMTRTQIILSSIKVAGDTALIP